MTVAFAPDVAHAWLTAPEVAPLEIPGWECTPKDDQTRGIGWLYNTPRALLADVTGTGKTIHGIGLAMLLFSRNEAQRVVFCVKSGTVGQWKEEWVRFCPSMAEQVVTNQGMTGAARRQLYAYSGWRVLITSYDLMWRDAPHIAATCPELVWFDESTSFKNNETATALGAMQTVANTPRIVCATATSIHNELVDLFSQLEVLGLAGPPNSMFGTREMFSYRYQIVRMEQVRVKKGRLVTRPRVVAYQNLEELTEKLRPFVLRRIGTADMPDVGSEDIMVPMVPAQEAFYQSIKSGDYSSSGKATYLLQAASTPANLGGPDDSGKLDWLMAFLERTGTEKVVVFSRWLGTVSAAARRLGAAGVGYRVFAGGTTGWERDEARQSFREDPNVRVIIITTAGEMGLNLQVSRWVVCLDLMWNPARIEQILGRVKRTGSEWDQVAMIRLITPGTAEENILRVIHRKQELADFVNGDQSDLFKNVPEAVLQEIIHGVASDAA